MTFVAIILVGCEHGSPTIAVFERAGSPVDTRNVAEKIRSRNLCSSSGMRFVPGIDHHSGFCLVVLIGPRRRNSSPAMIVLGDR